MSVSVNAACKSRKNVEFDNSSSEAVDAAPSALLLSAATTFLRDFFAEACGAPSELFACVILTPGVSIASTSADFLGFFLAEDGALALAV